MYCKQLLCAGDLCCRGTRETAAGDVHKSKRFCKLAKYNKKKEIEFVEHKLSIVAIGRSLEHCSNA